MQYLIASCNFAVESLTKTAMSAFIFSDERVQLFQNATEREHVLKISGSIYTSFAHEVWKELRHFLECIGRVRRKVLLVFEIEQINSVNVVELCLVLNSSTFLADESVRIDWACANGNEFMRELGQDISDVVEVPFQFI